MADTWESGVASKTLDEAFENLAQLDSILQQAKDAAAEAAGYADSIDPDNFASAEQGAKADAAATAVSYTITVPSTGWTSGTVMTAQATANPTAVLMEYAGGGYASYCTIQLLDTQDGSVVLWAAADPEESCQIKVTEVRSGGES